jgi:hypothetical protein
MQEAEKKLKTQWPEEKGYYIRKNWKDKRIFVIGDVHGSLHSLCDVFEQMTQNNCFTESGQLKNDVCVVSLGDLLDRSPYTLECLYLVLRLFNENPENCVLTAGNHETDAVLWYNNDGTIQEIKGEYEEYQEIVDRMLGVTQSLPLSLIATTCLGVVQMNHGSFENFERTSFAQTFNSFVKNDSHTVLETFNEDLHNPNPLSWGDVGIEREERDSYTERYTSNAKSVQAYFEMTGIKMLIRGHQDFVNLALQYPAAVQPPPYVQEENKQSSNGSNDFSIDNAGRTGYDLFVLKETSKKSFTKHLAFAGPDTTLLSVTTSTAVFSKYLEDIMQMSCFLVFEPI